MSKIELINVGVTAKGQAILKNINFSINHNSRRSERVCILGPNGCGKTTLFYLLLGYIPIDSKDQRQVTGKIRFDGKDDPLSYYYGNPLRTQTLAEIPQETGDCPSNRNQYDFSDISPEAKELLKPFFDDADPKAEYLSIGEQRRLQTAKILLSPPQKIILLDEPFSSTDAHRKQRLLLSMRQYSVQTNRTLVVITHDPQDAMILGTKLIILNQGQIEQIGTPTQIYSDPASIFVADFMSTPSINLFKIGSEVYGVRADAWSLTSPNEESLRLGVKEVERFPVENQIQVCYSSKLSSNAGLQRATFKEEELSKVTGKISEIYVPYRLVLRFDPKTEKRIRY